jgi:N-acyl-L-homoserine lactone synthetase
MSCTTAISVGSDLFIGPFQVEYAAGTAPRVDEYRLRHRVFVEERAYFPVSAMREGLERDEFDEASCSLLLRDARTGEAAACQRYILPGRLPAGVVTNAERFASEAGVRLGRLAPGIWAEVSRTTIAAKYRWGGAATSALPAMRAITYASLALAIALNCRMLFSISDSRTARLTRRLGFTLHRVAGPFDFHGIRELFGIDVDEVLRTVPHSKQDTLECLTANALQMLESSSDRSRS